MIIGLTGHTNIEKGNGKELPNSGSEYNKEVYELVYLEIEKSIKKICEIYSYPFNELTIVSGMARGADEIIAEVAYRNNLKLILSIPHTISWHKNRGLSRGSRPQAIEYDKYLEYKNTIKKNEIKKDYGGEKYLFANFARNKNIVDESDIMISYKKYNSSGTDNAIGSSIKDNKYFGNVDDIIKDDFVKPDTNFKFKYLEKEKEKKALENIKLKDDFSYNKISITDNIENINTMIIQGCNSQGFMGSGIAKFLKQEFPKQAKEYKDYHYENGLNVGEVIYTMENKNLYFGNVISQKYATTKSIQINYIALHKGLKNILQYSIENNIKVIRSPLIGTGLSGGNWGIIEFLFRDVFQKSNIIVEFYEIKEQILNRSIKELEKRGISRKSFSMKDFPKGYDFTNFKYMTNYEIKEEVLKYKKNSVINSIKYDESDRKIDKKKLKIIINDTGNQNGKQFYIGRPSIYKNPYPTKSSKFSDTKYPHDISMTKFSEERLPYMGVKEMIDELKQNGEITISCFCKNKVITVDNYKLKGTPTCHGEYIAEKVFEELELSLKEIKDKKNKRLNEIKQKNNENIELN